jgi:hypothetical protein
MGPDLASNKKYQRSFLLVISSTNIPVVSNVKNKINVFF